MNKQIIDILNKQAIHVFAVYGIISFTKDLIKLVFFKKKNTFNENNETLSDPELSSDSDITSSDSDEDYVQPTIKRHNLRKRTRKE
jgi:hypothetical protein